MTISSTTNTVSYTGNGSTTEFAVNYVFFGTGTSAEIQVVEVVIATGAESVKSNGSDFTVSGGNGATGTVTAAVAPASTVKWVINRATTQTQETDYVENDPFPAESHEEALDRLTAVDQEQQRALERTAQLPDGYTGSFDPTLPTTITGSTVLAFNAGANAFEIGPTTAAISGAAAEAAAAAVSADAAASYAAASEAALDEFTDLYLGAKASDPALDNDGNALQDGALYFDTTLNVMKVYDLGTTTWKRTTPTAGEQANIDIVAADGTDIGTVAGISANVTTVAGISSDVTTVAADGADIGTVAGISANVTTVAGVSANVTTVAGIAADVTTVAADGTDIGTVAGISSDVTSVAGVSANVTTVAGISGNVTTVAGISSDVTSVAGVASDVTTVAGISGDVSAVAAQVVGYAFSTTTAMADPGSGNVRFNNATLASVTAVAIDDLDSNGVDQSAYIALWDDSTNTVKGTLVFRTAGGDVATFNITGLIDNAGWFELAVTHVASSGTFSNAEDTFIGFTRAGDKGADGAGSGDVSGPGAAVTDNAVVRWDSSSGQLVQNSTVTISDVGAIAAESLTLTTDLAVADGGTGASTASAARSNLGAAASGANTDITSLDSGNIGIGTASASQKLTIQGTDARIYLIGANTDIDMTGTADGQLSLDGNGYGFGIALNSSGANLYTNTASRALILGTDETERMRIEGDGGVKVVNAAYNPPTTDNDLSFDQSATNNFKSTPTGSGTLTFTNHTAGQSGNILLDNSGGHAISLAATTKGDANLATTISAAGTYWLSYYDDGTNAYVVTSAVFA